LTLLKPSSSAARNRNRVRGIESDGEETEYKLNGVTARDDPRLEERQHRRNTAGGTLGCKSRLTGASMGKTVESRFMNEPGGAQRFERLSAEEQGRYIAVSRQLTNLARDHAVPIIFAPPLSIGGKLNGASGCVLRVGGRTFVVTASHVLAEYEKRVESGEILNWQVGDLPPFEPLSRIAWRDRGRDIVLLHISENEARAIGPCIISEPPTWPPCLPQEGQFVLMAGYPKVLREEDASLGLIRSGPWCALFRVTVVGEGYCKCLIERKDLISFNGGPLPEPGMQMGGLSGGPVLLVGNLSYPLVGVITDLCAMTHAELEILKVATLESVMIDENGGR
jgi:hypothetical protein